jgi:FkbM family methyltransferase
MSPYLNPTFTAILAEIGLHPNSESVIYELGARDALDSIALAAYFGRSSVHAFECLPASIVVCRENLSRCAAEIASRITLNEFAVGEAEATRTFYEYAGNVGASSFFVHLHTQHLKPGISVKVRRLRDYIDEGRPAPDLVCADIQGYETYALRGMGPHLAYVRGLILETPKRDRYPGNYQDAPGMTEVLSFLSAEGFAERARVYENDNEDNVLFTRQQ